MEMIPLSEVHTTVTELSMLLTVLLHMTAKGPTEQGGEKRWASINIRHRASKKELRLYTHGPKQTG